MRLLTIALVALLLLVHAELWFGRTGVRYVMSLRGQLALQNKLNAEALQRNERIANEVSDLRDGVEMIEEKARAELGMLRPDEILVQIRPAR